MLNGLFVQIGKLHEDKKVSDDLFALACLPDKRVRVYSACIADGVKYHTVDHGQKGRHKIVESSLRDHMIVRSLTSMVS